MFNVQDLLLQVCCHPQLVPSQYHLYVSFLWNHVCRTLTMQERSLLDSYKSSGKYVFLHEYLSEVAKKKVTPTELEETTSLSEEESQEEESDSMEIPIEKEKPQRDKIVIFCQHDRTITTIQNYILSTLPLNSLSVTRQLSKEEQYNRLQAFNEDPSYDVLLLLTSMGKEGICLNQANILIFIELDANPYQDLQV